MNLKAKQHTIEKIVHKKKQHLNKVEPQVIDDEAQDNSWHETKWKDVGDRWPCKNCQWSMISWEGGCQRKITWHMYIWLVRKSSPPAHSKYMTRVITRVKKVVLEFTRSECRSWGDSRYRVGSRRTALSEFRIANDRHCRYMGLVSFNIVALFYGTCQWGLLYNEYALAFWAVSLLWGRLFKHEKFTTVNISQSSHQKGDTLWKLWTYYVCDS